MGAQQQTQHMAVRMPVRMPQHNGKFWAPASLFAPSVYVLLAPAKPIRDQMQMCHKWDMKPVDAEAWCILLCNILPPAAASVPESIPNASKKRARAGIAACGARMRLPGTAQPAGMLAQQLEHTWQQQHPIADYILDAHPAARLLVLPMKLMWLPAALHPALIRRHFGAEASTWTLAEQAQWGAEPDAALRALIAKRDAIYNVPRAGGPCWPSEWKRLLELLPHNPQVRSIFVRHQGRDAPHIAQKLAHFSQLTHVSMQQHGVLLVRIIEGLARLPALTSLEGNGATLDAGSMSVTGAALTCFTALRSLRLRNIADGPEVVGGAASLCQALAALTGLTCLQLRSVLGRQGTTVGLGFIPAIATLALSQRAVTLGPVVGAQHLVALTGLAQLDLAAVLQDMVPKDRLGLRHLYTVPQVHALTRQLTALMQITSLGISAQARRQPHSPSTSVGMACAPSQSMATACRARVWLRWRRTWRTCPSWRA
jgi:hypothetical protein